MTRLPTESHDVEGFDGPDYELNILCAAPGCVERSTDVHHLYRRSFLGGPYRWVILPDDSHVGNVVGLCRGHHETVDRGQAAILWEGERFMWDDHAGVVQPLAFQPPHTLGDVAAQEQAWTEQNLTMGVDLAPMLDEHPHVLENECALCHQPLPKPKVDKPLEEKKVRRTWSITVPITERESGAETLDVLLEEARLSMARAGMAYGAEASTRWAVLSAALGLFVTQFNSIVSDA